MAGEVRAAALEALREAGPLSLDELVERLGQLLAKSRDPKQTVRNALAYDPRFPQAGQGKYAYLPSVLQGAAVRIGMDLASPDSGRLAIDADAAALLWPPTALSVEPAPASLELAGGPTLSVRAGDMPFWGLVHLVWLPPPFWDWWAAAQAGGADALVVRCLDGEAGRCAVQAVVTAQLDREQSDRNELLRAAAVRAFGRARSLGGADLAWRLLAQGAHHGAVPPDSLRAALFGPDSPFLLEPPAQVLYRPDMAPALRRLFAHRLRAGQLWVDEVIRDDLGLPPLAPPPSLPLALPPDAAAPGGYRLEVILEWAPAVRRVIEIAADHTLDDLHYAIQEAFGWDDDHLYSYFLGKQYGDSLVEVPRPQPEAEPPLADEIPLGALELAAGQTFRYLFDYGDQLRHRIRVQVVLAKRPVGAGPRIVERHGEAPPQYPRWDDDGDDDSDDLGDYVP